MAYNCIKELTVECNINPQGIINKIKNNEIDLDDNSKEYILAKANIILGNLDEAEKKLEKLTCTRNILKSIMVEALNDMGVIKFKKNEITEALIYLYRALEIALIQEDELELARIYTNLNAVIFGEGFYLQALEILNCINMEKLLISGGKIPYMINLGNLALIHYKLNEKVMGDYYFNTFLDIQEFKNNKLYIWVKSNVLYIRYSVYGEYDKAIEVLLETNKYTNFRDSDFEFYANIIELAYLYKKNGNEEKAVDVLLDCLDKTIKKNYQSLVYNIAEDLISWGYEDKLPRQLLVNLLISTLKRQKQDRQKLVNLNLRLIKEKGNLKKQTISKEQEIDTLNEMISNLEQNTIKDGLTDVYNRRYLDKFNDRNLFNSLYITLAMIDLDNFKKVNDSLGHLFGDRVLVEISNLITNVIGQKGKVFRYGGDEFFIIYEHNKLDAGLETLINLNNKSQQLIFDNNKVTLSIGAVTIDYLQEKNINIMKYIDKCDKLLYEGKQKLKNQVVHQYLNYKE